MTDSLQVISPKIRLLSFFHNEIAEFAYTMMHRLLPPMFVTLWILFVPSVAFVATNPYSIQSKVNPIFLRDSPNNQQPEPDDGALATVRESLQESLRIAKESSDSGAGFKQIIADVFAGDYELDQVNAKLDDLIASAPCVVFIWQASPFSRKAIRSLEQVAGVTNMKIVRLDDPWDEGNRMRSALGKRTGRTSVPSVWIGGKYVGGYDGGVDEVESPGIVDLAFRGELRPMLEAAGAFETQSGENVDVAASVVEA